MVKCGHSGRFPSHSKKDWNVSHSPQFKAIKKQPANSEETALVCWHSISGEVDTSISIWFAPVNISQCSKDNIQKIWFWRLHDHSILCLSCPITWCADVPDPVLLCRSLGTQLRDVPQPQAHEMLLTGVTPLALELAGGLSPSWASVLKTKSCICPSAGLAMERSNLFQAVASNTLLMGSLWQQGHVSADNLRLHSFAEWMPSWVNTSTVYLEKMKIRWNSWGFWQVEQFSPHGTGTVSLNLYSWNTTKVLN